LEEKKEEDGAHAKNHTGKGTQTLFTSYYDFQTTPSSSSQEAAAAAAASKSESLSSGNDQVDNDHGDGDDDDEDDEYEYGDVLSGSITKASSSKPVITTGASHHEDVASILDQTKIKPIILAHVRDYHNNDHSNLDEEKKEKNKGGSAERGRWGDKEEDDEQQEKENGANDAKPDHRKDQEDAQQDKEENHNHGHHHHHDREKHKNILTAKEVINCRCRFKLKSHSSSTGFTTTATTKSAADDDQKDGKHDHHYVSSCRVPPGVTFESCHPLDDSSSSSSRTPNSFSLRQAGTDVYLCVSDNGTVEWLDKKTINVRGVIKNATICAKFCTRFSAAAMQEYMMRFRRSPKDACENVHLFAAK